MPVEFTLPLTKLEQAVADARSNEKVMAAKVEEAKLILKSAKAAWEEAVGEVFRAIDEMITDKRQPSLPFDEPAAGDEGSYPVDPVPPNPVGDPVSEPVSVDTQPFDRDEQPGEVIDAEFTVTLPALQAGPKWRAMLVAEELESAPAVFDTLDIFGVRTMGELADALQGGLTFNLAAIQVDDLREAIEEVSQEDENPIRFSRDVDVPVTVKEKQEPEPQPEPEPTKPTKKGRGGRRPKAAAEPESQPQAVESTLSMDDL